MKFYTLILTVFLFTACAQDDSPAGGGKAVIDPAKAEKNKQTALLNKVTETTRAMQKLEQQGRDMDALRQWSDAESQRQCGVAMENRQRQVKDLEVLVKSFPNPFNSNLTAIIGDLNVCVSCSKAAAASCVKTRASLNQAIKEIYAQ